MSLQRNPLFLTKRWRLAEMYSNWVNEWIETVLRLLEHVGRISILFIQMCRTLFTTRFEWRSWFYQMEQVGTRSLGIAVATSAFIGMVMAIQFVITLEKYGAKDTIGRIVGLSETRELAPSLTALVVGSRVGAGMAAELGSMRVTEQIDAIRALGANPIRKLVVPRVVASVIVLPLLTAFALLTGIVSSMVVANVSYGVPMVFFWTSALDIITFEDLLSGFGKTPFFGFLIGILGCYFGMEARGGTEGVGKATTKTVVVVSIAILMADAVLTKLFLFL